MLKQRCSNNNINTRYNNMSNPKFSVGNNYKIIKKIGKGSFGEVYLAVGRNGEEYACKIEESKSSKNRLKGESLIYKRFAIKNLDCVPTVYKYIETPEYNLLVMQLLGKSLDVFFEDCGGKLDVGTVMKLGVTIINHLEKIHRIGIIHRDIKPNNFMFGIKEHANDLYVMDFGLSKKWYANKTHIEFRVGRSMIGTARYVSLNIHNGSEPSRRDDMESLGYMLIYLVKGFLPWQGLKKKTKDNPIDKIGEKKMMVDLEVLCEDLPDCFYEYVNYTRNLQFTEKPDYKYLKDLFLSSAKKNDIKLKYFWENTSVIQPKASGTIQTGELLTKKKDNESDESDKELKQKTKIDVRPDKKNGSRQKIDHVCSRDCKHDIIQSTNIYELEHKKDDLSSDKVKPKIKKKINMQTETPTNTKSIPNSLTKPKPKSQSQSQPQPQPQKSYKPQIQPITNETKNGSKTNVTSAKRVSNTTKVNDPPQ
nr:casein kinase I-like [Hydra vulgaris]